VISSGIQTVYSSELTTDSHAYARTGCDESNYYYETIQVNVVTSGVYILSSKSNIDTYGYIYRDRFNPINSLDNLLSEDNQDWEKDQFKLVIDLQSSTTYVLVVTTYSPKVTGNFSIFAYGPNNIILNRISECIYIL
jgi:hypothetical protein